MISIAKPKVARDIELLLHQIGQFHQFLQSTMFIPTLDSLPQKITKRHSLRAAVAHEKSERRNAAPNAHPASARALTKMNHTLGHTIANAGSLHAIGCLKGRNSRLSYELVRAPERRDDNPFPKKWAINQIFWLYAPISG